MMDQYKNIPSIEYSAKKFRQQIKYHRGQLRGLRLKMQRKLNTEEILDIKLLDRYERINKQLKVARIIYAELCYEKNTL